LDVVAMFQLVTPDDMDRDIASPLAIPRSPSPLCLRSIEPVEQQQASSL
jgi:hypothetical protein